MMTRRLWNRIVLSAIAFLLTLGTSLSQPVADKPKLRVGDYWRYSRKNIDGNSGYSTREISEILPDGQVRIRFGNGDVRLLDEALNFVPKVLSDPTSVLVKYPIRVGDEWNIDRDYGNPNEIETGRGKVVSYEKITVPAGTFECYVVFVEILYRQKLYSSRRTWKRWYCPDVKWYAKEVWETMVNNPYGPSSVMGATLELLEYRSGP
jgi:hypothetical protein